MNLHASGTSSHAKLARAIKEKEGPRAGSYGVYEQTHIGKNGLPIDERSKEILEQAQQLANERGIDLDSAMDQVLNRKRKLNIAKLFKAATAGNDEDEINDDEESIILTTKQAEELAIQAQKQADEAQERARMLEIRLAEAEKNCLAATRGEAAATAELAKVRFQLATSLQHNAKTYARKHLQKSPTTPAWNKQQSTNGDGSSTDTTLSPDSD